MQCVIPCGGLATRLGDLAKETPKSMMLINDKPFLEHQIELLKRHHITDFVFCVNHLKEQIEEYFDDGTKFNVNIEYSVDDQLGTIGAVKKAQSLLKPTFFIMYGDSYLPYLNFTDMYQLFIAQDKLAMLAVWKNNNYIDQSNIFIKNNKIISVDDKTNGHHIDYGVTLVERKAIKMLPENTPMSTSQFRNRLFKREQIVPYFVTKRLYHIGNPEALEETKTFIEAIE